MFLIFRSGGEINALPLGSIRGVVVQPRLTVLPTAPAVLMGLFNVRGEIVPLLDTAVLAGRDRAVSHPYAVVIDTEGGLAALCCDEAPVVVALGNPVSTTDGVGTVGTYEHDGELVVLLDPEVFLAPRRIAEWQA